MSDPVSRPGRSGMRTRGGTALAAWLVLLLAGTVWTTGPGTAHAASGTTARDRMVPGSLVSQLRANGAELTRLAPAHGLEGWNVRLADGSSYILYLTPDGAGLIGHLYGPDGRSVDRASPAGAGPGPDRHREHAPAGSCRSRRGSTGEPCPLEPRQ